MDSSYPENNANKRPLIIILHETKYFCTVKETVNWVKREGSKWENIFVSCTSDGLLISRLHEV